MDGTRPERKNLASLDYFAQSHLVSVNLTIFASLQRRPREPLRIVPSTPTRAQAVWRP